MLTGSSIIIIVILFVLVDVLFQRYTHYLTKSVHNDGRIVEAEGDISEETKEHFLTVTRGTASI